MLLKWQLYLAKFDDIQYCSQLWRFLAIYSIKDSFFDELFFKKQEILDRIYFFQIAFKKWRKFVAEKKTTCIVIYFPVIFFLVYYNSANSGSLSGFNLSNFVILKFW
jgi:hypothetical protein